MFEKAGAHPAFTAIVLGSLGSRAALGLLNSGVGRETEAAPHISPQHVDRLLQRVKSTHGVDIGYVHAPQLIDGNAAFASPEKAKRLLKSLRDQGNPLAAEMRKAIKSDGLIITGRNTKKQGIIEHELGHGVAAAQGNVVERANAKYDVPKYGFLYHTIPSYAAAIIGGKRGPLAGALAGGIAGGLTDAPKLYSEYSANKYGREISETGELPFSGLNFSTYLSRAVLPGALTGALYGALSKRRPPETPAA